MAVRVREKAALGSGSARCANALRESSGPRSSLATRHSRASTDRREGGGVDSLMDNSSSQYHEAGSARCQLSGIYLPGGGAMLPSGWMMTEPKNFEAPMRLT